MILKALKNIFVTTLAICDFGFPLSTLQSIFPLSFINIRSVVREARAVVEAGPSVNFGHFALN